MTRPADPRQHSRDLDTFDNPNERDFLIDFECPEFTCVCPLTGQPDFASFRIQYVPKDKCLEMKSLKLYFWSFRDEGHFHEAVTARILEDLVGACQPKWMRVVGTFNVRGGMRPVITVEYPELGSRPAGVPEVYPQ